MSPYTLDLESARLTEEPAGVHRGWRVLPDEAVPALAWAENEDNGPVEANPEESERLLPTISPPKTLQAGVTLNVSSVSKSHRYVHPELTISKKPVQKTKFQKRKEKLIAVLKPPYFIVSTIIVMVLVHILGSKGLHSYLEWCPGGWWPQPWRVITYGFVHADQHHLALNALVGLAVGWRLEREQGWWRLAVLWCGGVVAGALGSGVLQPTVRVVGASAGVYAMLLAHLPNVCIRFGHIPLWWFRPLSVVVLATSEASWTLQYTPARPVAWSAHALGAAAGIALAFLVFSGENQTKLYIKILRLVSAVLLVAGVVSASVFYALQYRSLVGCG